MSILRQFNFLGQERIDVSHFRSLESSIAADVDVLAGRSLAASKPLVVRGFNIAMAGAIGALATTLQVVVADGIFFNINATESGTFFWVPSTRAPETLNSTNPNVTGSFTANQTNYIGVDLIRSADVTTSDLAKFLDAGTLLEISKNVPLGRTLNYRFVISTSAFSTQSNICPIAQVVTNASNIVTTDSALVVTSRTDAMHSRSQEVATKIRSVIFLPAATKPTRDSRTGPTWS